MTTPLGRKIIDLIRLNGPISVSEYFALCLGDPEFGYYSNREPFGTDGDFITAPEISQLFGELIGIFLILAWQAHGRPDELQVVEIGPGRGTLMADLQRVIAELKPDMAAKAQFNLVETSARLRNVQKKTLAENGLRNHWHEALQSVPPGLTLLVANELFDAIPIRQFVRCPEGFRERVVTIDDTGQLVFATGVAEIETELLPLTGDPIADGTIFETAPARNAMMEQIASRLVDQGGIGLIIDYGHLQTAFGDTMQAVRNHGYEGTLASPGEADLTSHVDFAALGRVARAQGAHVAAPLTQGQFLLELGLLERAGVLGAGKSQQAQQAIQQSVNRLAGSGENQMGSLFKALCILGSEKVILPFERAD
ncbi:MAG: class I SAM-dependent methyltransferase [Alphaproteobacteria bacterium]|nr:class I SAM-dependent methyltransferase [Alphaproteobacteria bacterium]